jgi:predicted AAA+ superfamily ATPase
MFGARGTGKTTFLNLEFSPESTLQINLLDPEIDERLAKNPTQLITIIQANPSAKWVIIDEIQKNPKLLDVIQSLTKDKKYKFILTGSSARKLKRGAANLLAGRAFKYSCYPLTHLEIAEKFNLDEVLRFGSLPEVFSLSLEDKKDYLRAYVETYFKEEIVAEQIVRSLRPFKNFLAVAAQMNGKILNINKIANDVGVDNSTVQNYFEILEETLVGFLLEPFHESIRKRQRQASKFYYFDLGVVRALNKNLENEILPSTFEYGDCFEHFIILEIQRIAAYLKPDWQFSYLRTKDDAEIDFIIERPGLPRALIEIKSTEDINKLDKSLINTYQSLVKDFKNAEAFLLSQDMVEQKIGKIWCLPWRKGLKEIGLY